MATTTVADDDIITVVCTDPNPIQPITTTDTEIPISTANILTWDLPAILRHLTVKVEAHRNSLVQHSSYFHGLLRGSFSESRLDCITIEWNLETFLSILNCIYGGPLDVTSDNFLHLYEGALYFGVEMLLTRCKTWFAEVVSQEAIPQIQLDDLISIWSFCLEHARDFLPELCASYLARNFMWAMSKNSFVDIPYDLLQSCVEHMNLTVDSEMDLSNAILVWLDANIQWMEGLSRNEDLCTGLLKEIRISLLPLWFAAEKRSSCHFSKFADESLDSIFRLLRILSTGSINALGNNRLQDICIRLTKYSKKVNLSSCSQITSVVLLLSLLPSSNSVSCYTLGSIDQLPFNLEGLDRGQCSLILKSLPTLSFEAVQEMDISKCPRLHVETAIECFCRSFPSLRILKAACLLKFKISTLCKLLKKLRTICEVDLTMDTSSVIPSQVSIVSSSPAITPCISNSSLNVKDMSIYNFGLSLTKLTLQGRSDLCDSDLVYISRFCVSLQYLNLKRCISLTDAGIASLLCRCTKLHSLLVCDTFFGINSVSALCSSSSDDTGVKHIENEHSNFLAIDLQTLHMGNCKCVGGKSILKLMSQMQKLKSLCLNDTHLSDGALYSFRGSSLEMLDVSNTMVSKAALAHIIGANPSLKCLKVRGCRHLSQQETVQKGDFSSSYSCRELHNEIGTTCVLGEIAFGWGFSYSSLEALKPAIAALRKITVSIGGSLGEDGLRELPIICPMLESIILYFQIISDSAIVSVMENLKNLIVLAFCYCLGDISILSFKFSMPNLRKLKLERVTPWMTNRDLLILTQSCANLVDLSLLGCTLLNSESQQIISHGWPGLVFIHLEECGQVTTKGVSSLLDCKALEDLLLRHNGSGIQRSFIFDAALELPMLRKISLDLCDASEGDFDLPNYADNFSLTTVKIAKCKLKALLMSFRKVHKETLVVVRNSSNVTQTVVKERL